MRPRNIPDCGVRGDFQGRRQAVFAEIGGDGAGHGVQARDPGHIGADPLGFGLEKVDTGRAVQPSPVRHPVGDGVIQARHEVRPVLPVGPFAPQSAADGA